MDMKKTAVIIAITAALSCTAFANDKLCAVNNTGDKNSAVTKNNPLYYASSITDYA